MPKLEAVFGKTTKFDPTQYKSYDDLPPEQKENFVPLKDGGFITWAAAQQMKHDTKEANKPYNDRSFMDILRGKKRIDATDVAQQRLEEGRGKVFSQDEVAEKEDELEMKKIRNSMPEELKEKLESILLKGTIDFQTKTVNGSSFGRQDEFEINGLQAAIEKCFSEIVEDKNVWSKIDLKYKDNETSVTLGFRFDRETDNLSPIAVMWPTITVIDKEKEYKWHERFSIGPGVQI